MLAADPVYLDASVTVGVIVARDRLHKNASEFWADHIVANRRVLVSLLTLDETIYQLVRGLVAQAQNVHPKVVNMAQVFKQNPNVLAAHDQQVRLAVGYLLSFAELVDRRVASSQQVLDSWLDRMSDVGGLHDAWHLALAEHAGARAFATGDNDFMRLATLPSAMEVVKL